MAHSDQAADAQSAQIEKEFERYLASIATAYSKPVAEAFEKREKAFIADLKEMQARFETAMSQARGEQQRLSREFLAGAEAAVGHVDDLVRKADDANRKATLSFNDTAAERNAAMGHAYDLALQRMKDLSENAVRQANDLLRQASESNRQATASFNEMAASRSAALAALHEQASQRFKEQLDGFHVSINRLVSGTGERLAKSLVAAQASNEQVLALTRESLTLTEQSWQQQVIAQREKEEATEETAAWRKTCVAAIREGREATEAASLVQEHHARIWRWVIVGMLALNLLVALFRR